MVASVHPAVSNPMLAMMRRTVPTASRPNIMVAIPALITVDPLIASARRRWAVLNNRRRWRYANNNLRE